MRHHPSPSDSASFRVLVLSGGTAWGAYEAGVICGLPHAAGGPRTYDAVCGTSAGALNGAMYVSRQSDPNPRLRDLWRTVSTRPVLTVKPEFATILRPSAGVGTRAWQLASLLFGVTNGSVQGVCESDPVRSILREQLLKDGRIVDFEIPLFWTATDLTDGCGGMFYRDAAQLNGVRALSNAASRVIGETRTLGGKTENDLGLRFARVDNADDFIESLRASSAIPGVFDPAFITSGGALPYERLLVDGGVVNNTPLALVREAAKTGPVSVDVVLMGGDFHGQYNDASKNLLKIVEGLYALIGQRLLDDALRALVAQDTASRALRLLARTHASLTAPSASASSGPVVQDREGIVNYLSTQIASLQDQTRGTYLGSDVAVNVIRPSVAGLNGSSLDFTDQKSIDSNFDQGFSDVSQFGFVQYRAPQNVCELGSS